MPSAFQADASVDLWPLPTVVDLDAASLLSSVYTTMLTLDLHFLKLNHISTVWENEHIKCFIVSLQYASFPCRKIRAEVRDFPSSVSGSRVRRVCQGDMPKRTLSPIYLIPLNQNIL